MRQFYYNTLTAVALIAACGSIHGETVEVHVLEAGSLGRCLTDQQKEETTSLKVSGTLDGSDLRLLRWMTGTDHRWIPTEGKLTELDLSEAVLVEGGEPFMAAYNTQMLASPIWINARADALPEQLFSGSNLQTIVLPSSIKKIYSTFSDAKELTGSIVVPEGVQVVGEWAFSSSAIEEITLPSTLTNTTDGSMMHLNNEAMGAHVFDGCSRLRKVNIPAGVPALKDQTFRGCSSLPEIHIPATLTSIGAECFLNCTSLTDIYAEAATPATAAYRAFAGLDCSSITVHIPVGATEAYRNADGWEEFTNFREDYSQSGISEVTSGVPAALSGKIFNMQGIEVKADMESLPAGIYIINGRKVRR